MARENIVYIVEMQDKLSSPAKRAASATDRLKTSAKKAERETRDMGKALDATGRAGKAFGGRIGGAATLVDDLVQSVGGLSAGLGPAGVALGVVGASTIAWGFALQFAVTNLFSLARAAAEAGDKWAAFLPPERVRATENLGTSLETVDRLVGTLAITLATTNLNMTAFVDTIAGGVSFANQFAEGLGGIVGVAEQVISSLATMALSPVFGLLVSQGLVNVATNVLGAGQGALQARGASERSTQAALTAPIYGPAPGSGGASAASTRAKTQAEAEAKRRAAEIEQARRQRDMAHQQRERQARIDGQQLDLMMEADAQREKMLRAQEDAAKRAREVARGEGVGQALGALGSGDVASIIGQFASGPVGLISSAIAGLVGGEDGPQIDDALMDLSNNVVTLFRNLPQAFAELLDPQFLSTIIANGVEVLLKAMITLPLEIGAAVLKGIGKLITDFPRMIADALKSVFDAIISPFKDKQGHFLGTNFKGEDKRLFGIKLPSFQDGVEVARPGLAFLHGGERVTRASEARRRGAPSQRAMQVSGVTVVAQDPREFTQRLRASLGGYGRNFSIDPYVG